MIGKYNFLNNGFHKIYAGKLNELPSVKEKNPLTTSRLRTFKLVRNEDETGISGEGVVAEGVEFTDGQCALSWLTAGTSIGIYPNVKMVETIHGHNGRTVVKFDDEEFLSAKDDGKKREKKDAERSWVHVPNGPPPSPPPSSIKPGR